jgi:hypothetical protein
VRVTLSALCDYATVSQEGKLSIMGIFQEINAPPSGLPVLVPQMFVVVSFSVAPAEAPASRKFDVKLLAEDGAEVAKIEQMLNIPPPQRSGARVTINAIIGMAGLTFHAAGDHAFSILIDGDEKESIPLRVNAPT